MFLLLMCTILTAQWTYHSEIHIKSQEQKLFVYYVQKYLYILTKVICISYAELILASSFNNLLNVYILMCSLALSMFGVRSNKVFVVIFKFKL